VWDDKLFDVFISNYLGEMIMELKATFFASVIAIVAMVGFMVDAASI